MLIGSVAAVAYQIAAFVRISRAQRGEHVRPIALARYLPRFRQAERRLATLAEREKWSAARVAEHQLRLLNDLWAHASANVPYYRELAAAHRLRRSSTRSSTSRRSCRWSKRFRAPPA